jgi:CheY-like chemotaxis protein
LILESKPGEGTTVHLWLPVASQPAALPAAPTSGTSRGAPLSILLVDDELLLLMVGADMLESNGHRVTQAASGPEALKALQANGSFDLLITDHAMPGMTGAELAAKAKEIAPDIRIVVASGFQEIPGEAEANWLRLRKPYAESDLIELIGKIAPR